MLVCLEAADLDAAIKMVNENEYGNGTSIFTQSGATATHFRKHIEPGQVGINVPIPGKYINLVFRLDTDDFQVPLPMFSFTGNKKSVAGGGMTNFYGKSGLNFYTQTKTVTSLWREEDALAHDKSHTVMPTMA